MLLVNSRPGDALVSPLELEVGRVLSHDVDVGFDIESTGTDPRQDKLVLVSLKPAGYRGVYIDARHMDKRELRELLSPVFDGWEGVLVGHNLPFDISFLMTQLGLAPSRETRFWDTMAVELEILGIGWAEARKVDGVGMEAVAKRYGFEVHKEERNWFIDLDKREAWNQPFPPEQLEYARQDVSVVHKIKAAQMERVESMGLGMIVSLENNVLPATATMTHWGVQVNVPKWHEIITNLETQAAALESKLHHGEPGKYEGLDVHVLQARFNREQPERDAYKKWAEDRDETVAQAHERYNGLAKPDRVTSWSDVKAGTLENYYAARGQLKKPPKENLGVNLNSPQQLKDGFKGLGLVLPNTRKETLAPLTSRHPIIEVYQQWNDLNTLVERYGVNKKEGDFLDRHTVNGRFYPSWHQRGAGSGRYSSFYPNFQQMPRKGTGSRFREAIIPAPGFKLIVADFSNIELRLAAEMSGDKRLIDAFNSGQDVHGYVAALLFNLNLPEGTDLKAYTKSHNAVIGGREVQGVSERDMSKTSVYAKLYGAGTMRFAGLYGISKEAGARLNSRLYEVFPDAIDWVKRMGKVEYGQTIMGRRYYAPMPIPPPPLSKAPTQEEWEKWGKLQDEYKSKLAGRERSLANMPIQGSSADMTKLALYLLWYTFGFDPDIRIIAGVHDEILMEVRDIPETIQRAKSGLKNAMERAQREMLKQVAIGEVEPDVVDYWFHD